MSKTARTYNKMSRKPASPIPSREAWGNLDDLGVKYAFKLYGGKSIAEVTPYFIRSPIERMDELCFAPWEIFSYYIFWFTEFLTSSERRGECDSASCFLHFTLEKARSEPQKFKDLYPRLKPAVDVITRRQRFYEADADIYGLFADHRRRIETEIDWK